MDLKMRCIYDMETEDPDDALTLCLLAGHPKVNLIGVNVTPGTPHQIGVVRHLLNLLDRSDIEVGAYDIKHKKHKGTSQEAYVTCVSDWHYRTFGKIEPSVDCIRSVDVLWNLYKEDVTLITGASLKSLGKFLPLIDNVELKLGRLFVQGGFAGEGVVPADKQLNKFKGMRLCPTYNLNGDPKSALAVIASDRFKEKRFISKNVCHGVVYDQKMHDYVKSVSNPHPGLKMVIKGMESYLARRPEGKKFHDPLAAMCALNPEIGTWAEVDLYRENGMWGSKLSSGSGSQIIVDYNHDLFLKTMCAL